MDGEASFLLTNKKGGYCLFSHVPRSRYEGVFFHDNGKMFKTIEGFGIKKPVTKITYTLWHAQREREALKESFFVPEGRDALIYELSETAEFDLFLDCKESTDNRVWGRNYELSKESGCLLIKFSKRNDDRDYNSAKFEEFDIYIAAYSPEIEYLPVQEWEEHFYDLDEKRNSQPYNRWVFNACRIRAKEVVFAFSKKKEDAISEAKSVYKAKEKLKRQKSDKVSELIHKRKISDGEIDLAYKCSVNSLDSLIVDGRIFAGLPWFYQFWARDELVSLKALMLLEDYELVKQILFKHLNAITSDGHLTTFEGAENHSADAPGWLFKRIEDFIEILDRKNLLKKYLGSKELLMIQEKIDACLKNISENLVRKLVHNNADETWMDTTYNDDGREGCRIEIQALTLAMCRIYHKISGKEHDIEKDLKKEVLGRLWNGKMLADGLNDPSIRPNFFIAAYAYPELLSAKQWTKCIEAVLPRLWLSWGGLTTIDKKHKLFTKNYTGEDNKSYHRGDSWFWLNNLAAIVMHRINAKKFDNYIKKIIKASAQEILYKGATGHHSELSSASELRGEGCIAQAWSNAMFIELVNEVM